MNKTAELKCCSDIPDRNCGSNRLPLVPVPVLATIRIIHSGVLVRFADELGRPGSPASRNEQGGANLGAPGGVGTDPKHALLFPSRLPAMPRGRLGRCWHARGAGTRIPLAAELLHLLNLHDSHSHAHWHSVRYPAERLGARSGNDSCSKGGCRTIYLSIRSCGNIDRKNIPVFLLKDRWGTSTHG